MNRVSATLLLLFMIPNSGVPQPRISVHQGFLKAEDYLQLNAERQGLYAMGVVDGMLLAPLLGAPDKGPAIQTLGACIEGMNQGQVAAIIEKFLRDHPERWHQPLHVAVFTAMKEACPIKPPS